jgi:hypothetical protein
MKSNIEAWPRSVSRKTSGDGVKKLLMFEEVRRVSGILAGIV